MAIIECTKCGTKFSDKNPEGCPKCSGTEQKPTPAQPPTNTDPYLAEIKAVIQSIKIWLIISLVILSGLVAFGASQINAQNYYEYTIIAPSDDNLTEAMKTAGDNGWEIISSRRALSNGVGIYEIMLKRTRTTQN